MGCKLLGEFKLHLVIFVALTSVITAGCGRVNLNLDNLDSGSMPTVQLNQGAEFVSSSSQTEQTVSGFKIQHSAGGSFSGLQTVTAGGFRIYNGVQGQMISEDEQIYIAKQAAAAGR
jgi:hypothetical protein